MSKFYKLPEEEFKKMRSELTPAQKDILLYLRILDPFGDKSIDIGIRELAREMDLAPSTVSKAMEVLRDKGYIDMEAISVRVKVKSFATGEKVVPIKKACGKVFDQSNSVLPIEQTHRQSNKVDPNRTKSASIVHLTSETQTGQGVQISKTIKTIKTDQINQEIEVKNSEVLDLPEPLAQTEQLLGDHPKTLPTEAELTKFVKHQIESKGIEMRNPELYIKTAIARDRASWIGQWQENQRASRPVQVYKPEPWTPPDPEAGLRAIADAKAMIEARRLARG